MGDARVGVMGGLGNGEGLVGVVGAPSPLTIDGPRVMEGAGLASPDMMSVRTLGTEHLDASPGDLRFGSSQFLFDIKSAILPSYQSGKRTQIVEHRYVTDTDYSIQYDDNMELFPVSNPSCIQLNQKCPGIAVLSLF